MNQKRPRQRKTFEQKVRVAMAEAGIRSVSELARRIGRPRSTVDRVLVGARQFPRVIAEIKKELSL